MQNDHISSYPHEITKNHIYHPVVVLIGTDINDCDDVAGWRGNTEIFMGQSEAENSSEIILFVGVGKGGTPYVTSLKKGSGLEIAEAPIEERVVNLDIDVDEYRIKKRFDSSRKSEVTGFVTVYDPNYGSVMSDGAAEYFHPHKVHKDDIGASGTLFTTDRDWTVDIPSTSWSIQFFCYEYDWYGPWANIENYCVDLEDPDDDAAYDFEARRKYGTDVYFNECAITSNNWFPSVNSTKLVDNSASRFLFIRK